MLIDEVERRSWTFSFRVDVVVSQTCSIFFWFVLTHNIRAYVIIEIISRMKKKMEREIKNGFRVEPEYLI